MRIKTLTLVACLLAANTTFAVDWTPYLQDFKECGNLISNDDNSQPTLYHGGINIPKKLEGDITKRTHKIDDIQEITTFSLKNATAFGSPINKIAFIEDPHYTTIKLTFSGKDFNKVKSQFKLSINGKKYGIGANKAWAIKSTYNEKSDKFIYKFTPITFKKGQDTHKYHEQQGHYKKKNSPEYGIAVIDNTGWTIHFVDQDYLQLLVNDKAKTISCQ